MRISAKISPWLIGLLMLISFKTIAQKSYQNPSFWDETFISAQYDKGFLLAHRGALNTLANTYTQSFNFEFGKSTIGKKHWQALYNYPSLGIGYFRSNLGNDDVFGTANAFYGFYNSPFFRESKISLNFKFAFGLAYLSKKFDIDHNIYNVAIGSNLNYYVQLSLDLKVSLLENRFILKTGPSLSHMSNGKTQTPNLGLNLVGWHLTSTYYLTERTKKVVNFYPSSSREGYKHLLMLIGSGGFKEGLEPNLGKYFAGGFTLDYEYSFFKKYHFGVGIDHFYDGVVKNNLIQLGDEEADLHAHRMGIHASYSINYNKVSFIVQMGSYIAPFYTENGLVYHRIGFRAKVSKHLLANLSMKTYWGKAEIVEFGLGYYIKR